MIPYLTIVLAVCSLFATAYMNFVRPGRKRRREVARREQAAGGRARGPRDPRFTAATATAILRPDLALECVTFFPSDIPLDDAALLLNDLIGGPCVGVTLAGATQLRGTSAVLHSFHIGVLAAEESEAIEVLGDVGDLVRSGGFKPDPRIPYAAYRWYDGVLVPVISRWAEGKIGAIGQTEWAGD